MVVALAVLATLALIGLPAIRSDVPRLTLRAEVRQLVADLHQAQQLAITGQLVHRLQLRPDQNDYQLIRVAADGSQTVIDATALDEQLNIVSVPFTGQRIDFTPNGLPTESGTLTISHRDGLSQPIEIKPSGYIRLP